MRQISLKVGPCETPVNETFAKGIRLSCQICFNLPRSTHIARGERRDPTMPKSPDFPVPPEYDGSADPDGDPTAVLIDRLTTLFVRKEQADRITLGQQPAERTVFRKIHGSARARFEPLDSVPEPWRVGIFGHGALDAWVRFSSDSPPSGADLGTTLGVGIKLFGLDAFDSLGSTSRTADLIMQNYPVFFVDDLKEMVDFTYAGVVQKDYPGYLTSHPKTRRILDDMVVSEGSVLTTTYWGVLPFRMGSEIVKYRLDPVTSPSNVPDDDADYLAIDLAQRLSAAEYSLILSVQLRTEPDAMPLDRATEPWSEEASPYVPVARLRIPRQDVLARGQKEYAQNLAFNIWRAPSENLPDPESTIALARRAVYAAGANLRHDANGETRSDPAEPWQGPAPSPTPVDTTIVQAVIYPSIGIARVGNSPDEYLLGPEVLDPPDAPPGSYRDSEGRLKRQGARFRIYGVNAQGETIRELTGEASNAEITWQVELANTKAAWYSFQLALDIPEASSAPPSTLRNTDVADRSSLGITPGKRRVEGSSSAVAQFDDGTFMGKSVYLGEMWTDEAARLVVLGGRGAAASHDGSRAITFANNESWHDDVSDGPVTAEVKLDGLPLEVIGAWVVVAPPNYAPQRKSVRTMWDLMRDVAIQAGALSAPTMPAFTADILPIFQRLAGLQWVNAGFAAGFGAKGSVDLVSADALKRLSSPSPAHRELRRVVANSFRDFDVDGMSPKPWPWLYGDAMNIPAVATPRQNAALTATQLTMLEQWAEGWFVPDYDTSRASPSSIDQVPLAEQGDTLTRAALEFCLADAFHPGCEMTWPVRAWSMYSMPFRFAHAASGWRAPALGPILTADNVTIPNGPLGAQQAGDITRWMAVPWHTDTASCRSGYSPEYDPYVPTFWPARVPNQVLTAENYDIVVDESRSLEERQLAFANRAAWIEPLGAIDYTTQINNMIAGFDHLGVVEARTGTPEGPFPTVIEVEDQHLDIQRSDFDDTDDDAAVEARLSESFSATPTGSATGVRRGPRASAAAVDMRGTEKLSRFPDGLRN